MLIMEKTKLYSYFVSAYILLLCFFHTEAQGQNKKISLGSTYRAAHSYRWLKNADGGSQTQEVIKLYNDNEEGILAHRAGLHGTFYLQRLYFRLGLDYSRFGFGAKKRELSFPTPSPTTPIAYKNKHSYTYILIPISVGYTVWQNKKIGISLALSGIPSFYIGDKLFSYLYYENMSEPKIEKKSSNGENLRKMLIQGEGELIFQYFLSEKMSVAVGTYFNASIQSLNKEGSIYAYPYSIGASLGLNYYLSSQ